MLRVLLALLALAVTARAQDEGTPDPLATDKTLLASADNSAPDVPVAVQPKLTGAELFAGLEDFRQLKKELEKLRKEIEIANLFTLSNILGVLRDIFLGSELALQKQLDLRRAELDVLRARFKMASASFEFVKAVHDAGRGVSFSCPPDHTMGEMFEIVRVWLQENPGQQHLPAGTCVTHALKAKWPKIAEGSAIRDAERMPRKPEAE